MFAEAVEIDANLREELALNRTLYLHSLQMPLAWAVLITDGRRDGFRNECEWHCGV